jgi:hypothetical protein
LSAVAIVQWPDRKRKKKKEKWKMKNDKTACEVITTSWKRRTEPPKQLSKVLGLYIYEVDWGEGEGRSLGISEGRIWRYMYMHMCIYTTPLDLMICEIASWERMHNRIDQPHKKKLGRTN